MKKRGDVSKWRIASFLYQKFCLWKQKYLLWKMRYLSYKKSNFRLAYVIHVHSQVSSEKLRKRRPPKKHSYLHNISLDEKEGLLAATDPSVIHQKKKNQPDKWALKWPSQGYKMQEKEQIVCTLLASFLPVNCRFFLLVLWNSLADSYCNQNLQMAVFNSLTMVYIL